MASALVLGMAFVGPRASDAASATGTMGVSATVVDSCTVTATTLAFSTYSAADAAGSTGQATITVTCTIATAVSAVGLNLGMQPLTTMAQLKSTGAATIPYELFQDAGGVTPWTATGPAAFAATATPTVFTVYGKAPRGANVPTGTYNDTVGITVTYV